MTSIDKKGNKFAFCSSENECRNLVFLLVLTSRVELFVKKNNCRNLSLIEEWTILRVKYHSLKS